MTGGESAALAAMAGPQGGQSYHKAREAGVPERSRWPTASATRRSSSPPRSCRWPPAGRREERHLGDPHGVHQVLPEVIGEQIATALQDANEWAVMPANAAKTFKDYLADRPAAAAQTLIATLVGIGGHVGVMKSIQSAVDNSNGMQRQIEAANDGAEHLKALFSAAASSKLRERDPQTFAQFVHEASDDAGAPTEVYVDARVLAGEGGLFNQEKVAEILPSVAEHLPAALAAGTDVAIPVGELLAQAGTGIEQKLLEHLRTTPDGLSQAEAKEASKLAEEYLQKQAERVMADAVDRTDIEQSAEQVKAQILEQLKAANRFTPDVHDAYASLVRDFYTVTSQRLGIAPAEMFQRYPLRIAAANPAAGNLDQSVFHGTAAKFDRFSLDHIGTGEGSQSFGWGLYFAGNKSVAKFYKKWAEVNQGKTGGRVVKVEVPEHDVLLDYDAKLSDQPAAVQAALEKLGVRLKDFNVVSPSGEVLASHESSEKARAFITRGNVAGKVVETPTEMTGKRAYSLLATMLGSDRAASEALAGAGVPGLHYGDALSRNKVAAEKTRNYVIFDDRVISEPETVFAQSSGFEKWVGDATRVDRGEAHEFKAGEPVVVGALHGTTADFTEFDKSATNIESDLGGGFYFTNSEADAEANYAGFGPDLTQKIELAAERIEQEADGELDMEAAREQARKKFAAHGGMTMPVWVKFENPVVLGGHNETFLDYDEAFDEETEEYGEPTGDLLKVIEALREIAGDERYGDFDADKAVADIMDRAAENGGIKASELIPLAKLSEGLVYAQDYEAEGKLASTEILRKAFENAGFDGFIDTTVNDKFGEGKDIGVPMQGMDMDTVHFIAFHPEQIKSAIGNSGAFDPTNPDILAQGPRGTFNPASLTISLLEQADLSTFLHESGHFFLEVTADLASQPGAPAGLADDMGALLKWFGVKDIETWNGLTLEQQRPHHEKFAEAFEQYLFEGKAPSHELAPLFARFRAWLTNVYRSLTQFAASHNTHLNDEVRKVFDRMLAADDAIKAAEAAREYAPIFESAEQARMDPVAWLAYQEQGQHATDQAVEQLQKRSLRDMRWASNARSKVLKKLQREAAARRKQVETEVKAEVSQDPVYAVQHFIAQKENAALEPEVVAEMFGFTSADHMQKAIAAAQPEAVVVEGMTDQRLLERYGDLTTVQGLERAADEAVHNDARARFVATELRALMEAGNAREKTPRGGSVNVIQRAAKEFASALVARRKVRDLKPGQHLQAETRAARAAEKALAASDTQGAVVAKRDQLLNHYAARMAQDAQAEIEKRVAWLKKVGDSDALPPEYREQIQKLLERFDLRKATNKELDRRASLAEWVESQRAIGIEPELPDGLLNEATRQNYRDMTVEEFRGLVDTVKQIEHLGRLKDKLLTAKDQRAFGEIVQSITASIEEHAAGRTADTRTPTTNWGRAIDSVKKFAAAHIKSAMFARVLDGGKDGGPVWEHLIRPANVAGDFETTKRAEATKALEEILAPLFKRGALGGKGTYFASIGRSLNRESVIAIALNTGNKGNLQRLLGGEGWTLDQVQPVLDTLTKDEWTVVQKVWDYFETRAR
jgi:hypothetical protein